MDGRIYSYRKCISGKMIVNATHGDMFGMLCVSLKFFGNVMKKSRLVKLKFDLRLSHTIDIN